VRQQLVRDHPPNTIGNVVTRVVTVAAIVFGGVMDRCPDLRVCLAHRGGYTCEGIGRMDRGWRLMAVGVKRPAVDKPSSGRHESPEAAMLADRQLPHHVRAGHRERQSPSLPLFDRGREGDVVPVA
jgi:aminocarboxymuconate-semialdehyde decarboxylase